MADIKEQHTRHTRLWRYVPAGLILAGIMLAYALGWHQYLTLGSLADSREALKSFVAGHPVGAPLGFAVLYALAVAFSIPAASALTVFAGFLFGWLLGGMLVAVAATAGATGLFLAARSACGDSFRCHLCGRAARFAEGLEKDAFSYLLVLRLAPIFPFCVVNIAPAFFKVPLRTYVAATFLGILPATFAFAYLGRGVESVLMAATRSGHEATIADLVTPEITLAFAALALVAAIPIIIKKTKVLGR
ncbi:VTT domain-containing protein [Mesorhizobium sp. J18]|uniref:TVP38/TMEM64 family protein n=1 Tax=Mesorhizobium sp. J18 TaxID=935263 RepID=UPI0011A685C6|nr:VTT domain-containing protein [Mesorhizobium sp. J18]